MLDKTTVYRMRVPRFTSLLLLALMAWPASAQSLAPTSGGFSPVASIQQPEPMEILGVSVEGVESEGVRSFVVQSSGLDVGQTVTVPGDPVLADAIRSIYRTNLFADVKIVEERREGNGVYLSIQVEEVPKLVDFTFEGMKKGHRKDLEKEVPLIKGVPVRPGDIERSKQVIENFYKDKGYLLAEANVERQTSPQGVGLAFSVERGPRVEVGDIVVEGNEEISGRKIRKQMKETKEDRWWRFWSRASFDDAAFEEDLQKVVDYYNEKGYYDAKIVRDSVYLENASGDPELVVQLRVHEGPQYHIRNIEWEGNTVFPDGVLTRSLGFETGDAYNLRKLEENLYANKQSTDVASLYTNRGYMRFNFQQSTQVVEGDSLDLVFDVFEGEVYDFGDINIAGNDKTKEHVIRRELYTIPGQTYSREAVMESIRRLSQLSYFDQEALAGGPSMEVNDATKTVEMTYNVEEVGGDQLELSGTWGRYGLILMLRLGFNNFSAQNLFKGSAWKPLPSGDGQKLSLGIQTNGRYYQSYDLSFTEPWFRGRPTPIGGALSFSKIGRSPYYSRFSDVQDDRGLTTASVRGFYEQRLKWPDDKFNASSGLTYRYYNINGWSGLPEGVSQEVTFQQSLTRNSVDNPVFPTSGSRVSLSVDVAAPLPGFIQYHKWRAQSSWNVPLGGKLALGLSTDFGYIGSLTGEDVEFERFLVGGSPFETQGIYNSFFGKDVVLMRGYPARAISPRQNNTPVGGRVLNKYTSEIRWLAVQSQQLSAAPYLFLDAANTWNSLGTYSPAQLYRSTGVGVRLVLPILGMLELTYGRNLDVFDPVNNSDDGSKSWTFQFSLGQGFGQ